MSRFGHSPLPVSQYQRQAQPVLQIVEVPTQL